MNVMLLAAGEGTRLRPFTLEAPKPCIPFLGAPLACYSLSLLDGIQIDRLVVNTYHLPEKIKALFKYLPPVWKDLKLSPEKEGLLGSGGGIHNAEAHLKGRGDFIVLNGDEVILPHEMGLMKDMLAFHKWHEGIATLLTMSHPEVGTKFGGAWLKSEGTEVQCFSKTAPGPEAPRGQHFLGVMILSEKVFDYFNEDVTVENILYETLTKAMADHKKVHAFECKAEWFETGNPVDFMKATEYCVDALMKPETDRPYWQEYLKQTMRLYAMKSHLVDRDWNRLPELQNLIVQTKKGN